MPPARRPHGAGAAMHHKTYTLPLLILLATWFGLVGCITPDDDGPLITYKGGANGDDAMGGGILTLRGACLGRTDANRDHFGLFALPKSAKWIESEQAIEYKGTKVRVGEPFRMGGGSARRSFDNWSSAPDPSCVDGEIFLGGSLTSCATITIDNRQRCQ